MAIKQIKYIRVMGPIDKIDEFILKHVINRDIQLEPVYKHLNVPGLIPFTEDTSLDNLKKRMSVINEHYGIKIKEYDNSTVEKELLEPLDVDETEKLVQELEDKFSNYRKYSDKNKADILEREQILKQMHPLLNLDINIDDLFNLSFIKFRFGSVPKWLYNRQKEYLNQLDVVTVPVSEEDGYLWISYFVPAAMAPVIDNVSATMGFKRIRIPEEAKGTPKLTIERIKSEIAELKEQGEIEKKLLQSFLEAKRDYFDKMYHRVCYINTLHDVKQMCSHSKETFFLAGWIPNRSYNDLKEEVDALDKITLECEDPDLIANATPPTIMKNSGIFKPFESLVSMYGLPSDDEIDPTPLFAITYILMFGFMFGDVGQGAIISLLGLFLYKRKNMDLGGVMFYIGISSVIFGFVYGSVFGNEEVLQPLWLSPLHSTENINMILYGSVAYGAFIIIFTMVINMINNIRKGNWGKLLFDKNGLAGFLFYGGIVGVIITFLVTGRLVITTLVLIVVVILPTLMILFKGPLENLILRKDRIMPEEKGIYFIESGFDIFETLLSFFSSTISFARVGAFALNHAGLSLAVWTLYGMSKGVGGVIIVIVGNIITIGLEGLIVGIQCMRLEFYEMFSRYYVGEGREFRPVRISDK